MLHARADEPPPELIDAAADAAISGEGGLASEATDSLTAGRSGAASAIKPAAPPPTVAQFANRVPSATRALLADLFKAEISTVRGISRDQLR